MLGFLILLTIVLAIVGYEMHHSLIDSNDMTKDRSAIAKSIQSVSQVNTGEAIVAVADTAAEEVTVAFDGTLDGKTIYDNVCMACHNTGAAGAPKLEAAAWTERMAVGIDGLVTSAIAGKGAMPPRGGRADLSDEQMKAVVEFMTAGF